VNVGLFDENLTRPDGHEGGILAEVFRKKFPRGTVISISSHPQKWSDRPDLTSGDSGEVIAQAVTDAP